MLESLISGLEVFGIRLENDVLAREEKFLAEMLRWNERINLTSIDRLDEALEKHLLDSLILLQYLPESGSLLDMGSGGGLPGIPLAIARPGLQVQSVDSVGKKINFQKHIKRMLSIDNFHPEQGRLDSFASGQYYDFITARALSHIRKIVNWADPCLRPGGRVVAMKGPEGELELQECSAEGLLSNYEVATHDKYFLPFSGAARELIILSKSAA